jgi:hypothetical protein
MRDGSHLRALAQLSWAVKEAVIKRLYNMLLCSISNRYRQVGAPFFFPFILATIWDVDVPHNLS